MTQEKTNVMRVLSSKKIEYKEFTYPPDGQYSGADVANLLGQDPKKVFKTLVTQGKSGKYYVFDIPVECELDLKKAAKAVDEKSIEMIKSKDLLPITGYIHGGCSPIGMKKQFRTTFHESCLENETVMVSGGRIGFQVELRVEDLKKIIKVEFKDIIKN